MEKWKFQIKIIEMYQDKMEFKKNHNNLKMINFLFRKILIQFKIIYKMLHTRILIKVNKNNKN
jgi:hypothetical protein